MTISRARFCAVALLVVPLVGACGSGGDNGEVTGAKGTYVAQVDPICADLNSKVGELGQDPARQAGDIEAASERIKAIPRPQEDQERADLFIAALSNTWLSLQDVDQARMVNDQARAAKALSGAQANAKSAAAAAKLYGMKECAKPL